MKHDIDATNRKKLSEYFNRLAALKKEEPEHLPAETWDAFFLALREQGGFPEEYADIIGKNNFIERKHHFNGDQLVMDDGEQETTGYYEIRWEAWNSRVHDLNSEFHDVIWMAIKAAAKNGYTDERGFINVDAYIKNLLEETPERLEEWARISNSNTLDEVLAIIVHRGEPPKYTPTNGKTYTFNDEKEQPVFIVKKGRKQTIYTLKSWEAWQTIRTSRGGIEKFLFHFLTKVQEETNGNALPETVRFDARQLTSDGNYASVQKAKAAAETFFKTFGAFRFEWEEYTTITNESGKKNRTKSIKHDYWIHEYKDERGTPYFSFTFSSDIPPGLFAGEWTLVPRWIHKLKAPSADVLLYKLCRLQRTNRNANGEPVILKNDSIRFTMGLPKAEDVSNRRYNQLIKKPIKKAIDEINTMAAANGDSFHIVLNEPQGDIHEWLTGKTAIYLPEDVTRKNAEIEDKRQNHIAEKQAKNSTKKL